MLSGADDDRRTPVAYRRSRRVPRRVRAASISVRRAMPLAAGVGSALILVASAASVLTATRSSAPPAGDLAPNRAVKPATEASAPRALPPPQAEERARSSSDRFTRQGRRPAVVAAPIVLPGPHAGASGDRRTIQSNPAREKPDARAEKASAEASKPEPVVRRPLFHLYKNTTFDHFYATSSAQRAAKMKDGYRYEHNEGFCLSRRVKGSVPIHSDGALLCYVFAEARKKTIPLYRFKAKDDSGEVLYSSSTELEGFDGHRWQEQGAVGYVLTEAS